MTKRIHTNGNYTNVGMLEILNEPLQDTSRTQTMISEYYPTRTSEYGIRRRSWMLTLVIAYMSK